MSYTDNPSHEAVKLRERELDLIEREQNLKFINYCPACDKWIKQGDANGHVVFRCECGLERFGNPTQFMH